ncbi:MAG: phosphate signaling complex PhoU family protein, partial [Bacilli bacterium]
MENLLNDVFEELNKDIDKMARYIITNHNSALNALYEQNKKQALEVIEYDERINQIEENINNKVVIAIARYQPVAGDLRRLIGIMKLANDLERIGDYAKSIAKVIVVDDINFVLDDSKKIILDGVYLAFIKLFEKAIK